MDIPELEKRYGHDVQFQSVVDSLVIYLHTSRLTPRDITAAALLATTHFLKPTPEELKAIPLPYNQKLIGHDKPGPTGGE